MLRNEALLLLPALLAGNADLQKIIAFSGAFEKLIDIIAAENGIEGGIVVQDALTVIGTLLRFNVSNQVSSLPDAADDRTSSASSPSSPPFLPSFTSPTPSPRMSWRRTPSPSKTGPSRSSTTPALSSA